MSTILSYTTVNRRKNNEDCCLAFTVKPYGKNNQPLIILLLADGMGGHEFGELMSRYSIETMSCLLTREFLAGSILPNSDNDDQQVQNIISEETLYDIVVNANRALREKMAENGSDKGGSTISAAVVKGNSYCYVNLGDSLIYHWSFSENKLYKISDDHSVPGMMLKSGMINEEQAHSHHLKHHLVYFMGIEDVPPLTELQNTGSSILDSGDIIMLCSDGICGDLKVEEIDFLFKMHASDKESLISELILASRLKGQTDNQSLILFGYQDKEDSIFMNQQVNLSEEMIRSLVKERFNKDK